MQGALPLASPGLNPRGTGSLCRCGALRGLALLAACCPLPPAFTFFSAPYPPSPLPLRGRGRFLVYFAGGFAPGTPALDRSRHLQSLPSGHPAQGACGCPQKRQEAVPYEQCRQPRRGGTGGEELRRLRWSSPPGQGKQVPPGFSTPSPRTPQRQVEPVPPGSAPLLPPPGTTAARSASAAGGGGGTPPSPPLTPVKTVKSW